MEMMGFELKRPAFGLHIFGQIVSFESFGQFCFKLQHGLGMNL